MREVAFMTACISDRLREALEEKGWSQQTLSKRSGVHHQQIYKLLSGETLDPRVSTMRRLAQALDVTTDYLLGITEGDILENQLDANVRKDTPENSGRKRKVAS
jgi:transcriptional regulator with XRE-family HTH domain